MNSNIMKTSIFHKMKYDLKGQIYVIEMFCNYKALFCMGGGGYNAAKGLISREITFVSFHDYIFWRQQNFIQNKQENQLPESWGFSTTIKDKNAGIIKSGIHKHELSSSFIKMAATMKNTTMIPDNTLNTTNSRLFIRSALANIWGSFLYNAE